MAELILHDLSWCPPFVIIVAVSLLSNFIDNRTRTECGFAAVLDLKTGALEDKQPSFLTSETLKYLYLTFDVVGYFLLSFNCYPDHPVVL